MAKTFPNLFLWLIGACVSAVSGCAHRSSDEPVVPISWDELAMVTATSFHPSPEVFLEDVILSDYKLARLPHSLRGDRALARLTLSRGLESPAPYHQGVFGEIGHAKMYVTTGDRVKSDRALYGVILRVLSEKYGCFLRGRIKSEETYRFLCRDNRQVVLWPTRGEGWVQFYARQFDQDGYEIKVENRRIVRVSQQQVLASY